MTAEAVRYGSAEAFGRAFRAVHGVTPGQARRTGAVLVSQSRLSFRLTVEGSAAMRYRVVEKEAFRLVGVGARFEHVHEGTDPAMVAFFEGIEDATHERLEELSDQEPFGGLSVTVTHDPAREEGGALDYEDAG